MGIKRPQTNDRECEQHLVVCAVGVLIFLLIGGAFNRLVRLRNEITNALRRSTCSSNAVTTIPTSGRSTAIPGTRTRHIEGVTAARAQVIAAANLVKSRPNQASFHSKPEHGRGVLASHDSIQKPVEAYSLN